MGQETDKKSAEWNPTRYEKHEYKRRPKSSCAYYVQSVLCLLSGVTPGKHATQNQESQIQKQGTPPRAVFLNAVYCRQGLTCTLGLTNDLIHSGQPRAKNGFQNLICLRFT